MIQSQKLVSPAVWFFYAVIVFEFLFMITPFALYFYSAYAPALNVLNSSPYTAWLTGFFLPHFSQTRSSLLPFLNAAGWWLAYFGLALFLLSAIQLYGSKLLRRDSVDSIFYRYVRHPQYLALAILGLGTTLIWPRFFVLITFVTMLFLYRILARIEEKNCLRKYGPSYGEYLLKTAMFLPRLTPRKSDQTALRQVSHPAWFGLMMYVIVLTAAVVSGLGLREHMLDKVSAIYQDRRAIISPALLPGPELLDIYQVAATVPDVGLYSAAASPPLLVYVVPGEWYLPDLPLDSHELVRQRGGHGTPTQFKRQHYRVLFTSIRSHSQQARGRDILRKAYAFNPLLLVDVDMKSRIVTDVSEPPGSVVWGDISPPLF